ncbi:phage tail protein [Neobacillus massiliamazoniensis]|uniref:Putative minor structural protein n=1 Tax=Neobacillus massiliamazoniensis TaxID=1499688 RepID=A0A0U1NRC1_9BACI|nr:phage tail protein [Neobacillus massiliamazoniensis]CRK80298.1 putative minor structural protein [Neobacillus massiliamazoniensis]
MLIITDIVGNTEALIGYKGLKRFRSVSGEKTLAFLIFPTEQNAHSFDMVQEESIIEFKGETYRIKQMNEKNKGQTFHKEVVAIHTFFDLIDEHQYDTHNGSMTFDAALQFVFAGTGYTWAVLDTFYAESFENFGNDNRLSLFQKVLKRYGAEFTINGTFLTLKRKIGNATDFQFRYSYNVKTINRSVDTNNLSTYIKGFGKQNEDGSYVVKSEYTSPNAAIFGIRHAKPVYDERYTTLEGLNERLVAELIDTPEVSITLDFADLRMVGFPYDVPGEGDDVFLIYEPMNLDLETRIIDITEAFSEFSDYPVKTDVTLANFRNNMTDQFVEFSRTQKTVTEIIEGNRKLPYRVLDDAVKRATEALQSAQTEVEFNNGFILRSKENPNYLVLVNSAGIGVSLDGGKTFRTAMTAEGFVADLITSGTMLFDRLYGGTAVLGGPNSGNGSMIVQDATGAIHTTIDGNGVNTNKVTIRRPDGFHLINNGMANFDFGVMTHDPPFMYNTFMSGYWYGTKSPDWATCNYYTFRHAARYLKFGMSVAMEAGSGQVSIHDTSGKILWYLHHSYTLSNEYYLEATIDLGVPTGAMKNVFLRISTDDGKYGSYVRVLSRWLEG